MAWVVGQKIEGRYDDLWWEAEVEEVHKEGVQVTAHDACVLTLALLLAWDTCIPTRVSLQISHSTFERHCCDISTLQRNCAASFPAGFSAG